MPYPVRSTRTTLDMTCKTCGDHTRTLIDGECLVCYGKHEEQSHTGGGPVDVRMHDPRRAVPQ